MNIVASATDAQSPALRRSFYEAWSTRASDRGPTADRFDNTAVIEELLRLREHDPVHRTRCGFYLLSNYDDVAYALRQSTSFAVPDEDVADLHVRVDGDPGPFLKNLEELGLAARPAGISSFRRQSRAAHASSTRGTRRTRRSAAASRTASTASRWRR